MEWITSHLPGRIARTFSPLVVDQLAPPHSFNTRLRDAHSLSLRCPDNALRVTISARALISSVTRTLLRRRRAELILFVDPKTEFAVDLGGVFEYYLSGRLLLRTDVGNTLIRFSGRRIVEVFDPPIGAQSSIVGKETRHNLHVSVGVGFRF
jgi:hypothetical protein